MTDAIIPNQNVNHAVSITLKTDSSNVPSYLEISEKFIAKTPTKATTPRWKISENAAKTWTEVNYYPFRQVTVQELTKIRLSGTPGIVYKKDDTLFYATIPANINIYGNVKNVGKHMCSENCAMVCNGCPRTSSLTVTYQQRIGKSFPEAVEASWRIDQLLFIREGLEAFNMDPSNEAFIVWVCEWYKRNPSKKHFPME